MEEEEEEEVGLQVECTGCGKWRLWTAERDAPEGEHEKFFCMELNRVCGEPDDLYIEPKRAGARAGGGGKWCPLLKWTAGVRLPHAEIGGAALARKCLLQVLAPQP